MRSFPLCLAAALLFIVAIAPAEGWSQPTPPMPVELLEGVGAGELAHMSMLFQVTFVKIDIFDVDVWVDADTASRLEPHVVGKKDTKENLRAAAKEVLDADTFVMRLRFRRDSGIDRMMKGTRKNLENAAKRGLIEPAEADSIGEQMSADLADLEERGIQKYDSLVYRATDAGVRTVWLTEEGEVLLDEFHEGVLRGRALRAAYFAEGSKFWEKLLKSLYEG